MAVVDAPSLGSAVDERVCLSSPNGTSFSDPASDVKTASGSSDRCSLRQRGLASSYKFMSTIVVDIFVINERISTNASKGLANPKVSITRKICAKN